MLIYENESTERYQALFAELKAACRGLRAAVDHACFQRDCCLCVIAVLLMCIVVLRWGF